MFESCSTVAKETDYEILTKRGEIARTPIEWVAKGRNCAIDSCRAAVEAVLDRDKIRSEIARFWATTHYVELDERLYRLSDCIIAYIKKELWGEK